jgi:uncharacterized membrane protein YbaN (DUF454 family)
VPQTSLSSNSTTAGGGTRRVRLRGSAADGAGPTDSAADRPIRRVVFASAGVVLVGVGAVGVIVPGLPTTIWLIGASYLFARSHPGLEARLIRNRFFGPYLRYLDRPATMPRRAKITTCALMWTSVGVSLAVLAAGGKLSTWLGATIVGAAVVGTWFICRFGRNRAE